MKKRANKNVKEKATKIIKTILFISAIVLIYMVSPQITYTIQNGAKYLYELDSTYIIRTVELILAGSLVLTILVKGGTKDE